MKITHVYKDAYPPLVAGITRYISMVSEAAVADGHEVEIIVAGVRRSRTDVLPNGVVVKRIAEFGRAMSNPLSPGLVRAVSGAQCDVMHVHMPNPLTELGALQQDAPIVTSFHAQLGRHRAIEAAYAKLQRRVLERTFSVMVSSPIMIEIPELRGYEQKVVLLPYGVDPSLVGSGPVARAENERLRLLFVGRLVPYKGLGVLLDALTAVGEADLTIVGAGPMYGEIAARLKADKRLNGRVELRGEVSDSELAREYRSHNAFVLPSVSKAESFGISVAEAISNGLPTITSEVGTGTDWVNEDNVSGLTVPASDPVALSEAIEALKPIDTWRRLSQGAWELGQQRYSAAAHYRQLGAQYEGALK